MQALELCQTILQFPPCKPNRRMQKQGKPPPFSLQLLALLAGLMALFAIYASLAQLNVRLARLQEACGTRPAAAAAPGLAPARPQRLWAQAAGAAMQRPGAASGVRGIDAPPAFLAAASANVSAFQHTLLRRVVRSLEATPPVAPIRGDAKGGQLREGEWELFGPVLSCPPDRPLRRYGGKGDGSKLLCDLSARHLGGGCVIYSLGSRGNFKFEEAMLAETTCEIHTFDCTYNGTSISPGRHHYHPWCTGSAKPEFKSWAAITSELGHSRVDLLKMDIEGHEYSVLSEFAPDDMLPVEMSMELHSRWRPGQALPYDIAGVSGVFAHLAALGYAPYAQEVNPQHPECCSEFSFLRVWPLVSS